ncbi:MAG: ubiquitin-protein ligase [Planctomycetota bacterium]|nr:ubiquitin-protein ligase [Planctomycetota bacterium]
MSTGRSPYESPQMRRLKHDFAALETLRDESTIFHFRSFGQPAQRYLIEFRGLSLARDKGKVVIRGTHEVEIKLGVSYPRTMPELRWITPIYHPNISEIGLVCLGGYGTHWVPSLHLDDLCNMLWDMARYHNYDIRSPYNREAALWAANQTTFAFPVDPRPLRDKRVALGRIEGDVAIVKSVETPKPEPVPVEAAKAGPRANETQDFLILDMEVDLRRPTSPMRPPRPPQDEVMFID